MSEVVEKTTHEEVPSTEATEVAHTVNAEETKENPEKRKLDSKWEIIDKIKASDNQAVVINIFRVHPEATWKDIKDVYKEIQMKIEKVPNKEGMFNLHFRNHNEAINFIKISPKPVMEKKFLMRLNERIKKEHTEGWNEMGADGHTAKFETQKYFHNKAKNYKKNVKKGEEGEAVEQVENVEGEVAEKAEKTEEVEEGLNLPTRSIPTDHTEVHAPRTRKIEGEHSNKRFIGEYTKPNHYANKPKNTEAVKEEIKKSVEEKAPQVVENWNTVKDPVKEKKIVEETKKTVERIQKEKEASLKKEEDTKKTQAIKTAAKKTASNFTDGW